MTTIQTAAANDLAMTDEFARRTANTAIKSAPGVVKLVRIGSRADCHRARR